MDFLVPGKSGSVRLVECKASKTVTPTMAGPMRRLVEALKSKRPKGTRFEMHLVHEAPRAGTATEAVAPGVRAQPWKEFVANL